MTPDEVRELVEALRSSAKVDPVLWGMATKAAAIMERLADRNLMDGYAGFYDGITAAEVIDTFRERVMGEDDLNGPVNLDDDDGFVTLRVPPDSLEAAIAGTRRGERWDNGTYRLVVDGDGVHVVLHSGENYAPWQASGWYRVEEPKLKCPACGSDSIVFSTGENGPVHWRIGCLCGVRGPWVQTSRDATNGEQLAREAFRRIGR